VIADAVDSGLLVEDGALARITGPGRALQPVLDFAQDGRKQKKKRSARWRSRTTKIDLACPSAPPARFVERVDRCVLNGAASKI